MPEDSTTEVTAAGIARLAGVGRAAVSNWRRRHADFPKPVGGTETSPSFALGEIEQWLRDQGKLAEVPLRERVWQQLAGHPSGTIAALVHAGCVLLLRRERPRAWTALGALPDARLAEVLPTALEETLTARFGVPRAVRTPTPSETVPAVPLLRAAVELADELGGPREAFEFLLGRHLDANPRQYTLTPPPLADLMAELAAAAAPEGRPLATVVDPASGTGGLLRAVPHATALFAQDTDPDLAALTALRLALHGDADIRAATADTLRADAFPDLAADAVLCHPPFNERAWGHDELAYDARWEYGFPARTESELAWVQHALARLRAGGAAVLLMPPAVASRRSGRRIRADLLRRGALRAVVALPAGAAPPYGIPLHLWVLVRPGGDQRPPAETLFVDTAGLVPDAGRDKLPWATLRTTVLDAWAGRGGEESVARAVPVIELLDDEVDLAPARYLTAPAAGGTAPELAAVRARLDETLRRTQGLAPSPVPARSGPRPLTTVGELARTGALQLRTGGSGTASDGDDVPVLTEHDVLSGGAPSGTLPGGAASGAGAPAEEPVLVAEGDVVVPVLGGGSVARVVDAATAGAALGRNLQLLRPDPAALDPWFLAGFLRGTANNRQASSFASTATRLDVRRLQLPRLPLADQRRHGAHFKSLAEFEEALRLAARLGEQLVQGLYDGLADGSVEPG
ncbi:N-6 DNA methylase [Streptomyces lateritius]|uniref:N-6 DNA methylase n=1 Tax=Streptomyces lateritius TaxID=67313 RepID=UPI001C8C944D|nr:N-6 DNA methylase [Streptomyces lateritius]MBX9424796.1 N-6 DNA methylase [Streptomyces lateritius]